MYDKFDIEETVLKSTALVMVTTIVGFIVICCKLAKYDC